MTAKYLPTNQLQELPQMEEPRPPFGGIFSDYWEIHKKKMLAYKKEVAACRTLNCHEDCKRLWEEGDVLEEGKDYEVKNNDYLPAPIEEMLMAFPLVPVKSEDDDRWEEAFLKLRKMGYNPAELEMHITELKKHYTLTKKQ